jgi:ketosteroid isomerase-like protein
VACYRLFSVAAAVLVMAGCARSSIDSPADKQELSRRDAEWAALATAGKDAEKTASYWSDDAVLIPPGQPSIEGKAAIQAFVASSFQTPGFKIHWESEPPVFSPDGKLAYMRSTSTTTVPGPNGALITLPGRGITVWRVDSDGQWRCVVDIWNDPPSAREPPK